ISQIIRCAYEAFSEMVLPHAVDHHSSGQHVAFVCDGVRKLQPSASIFKIRTIGSRQNFQETAWHNLARCFSLPSQENRRIRGFRTIYKDRCSGRRAGIAELQHVALLTKEEKLVAHARR